MGSVLQLKRETVVAGIRAALIRGYLPELGQRTARLGERHGTGKRDIGWRAVHLFDGVGSDVGCANRRPGPELPLQGQVPLLRVRHAEVRSETGHAECSHRQWAGGKRIGELVIRSSIRDLIWREAFV